MATMVLTDGFISIGGVDLSDHMKSGSMNYEAEALDQTAMGADTRLNVGGLKNWSVEATFYQDYAAGETDATIFSKVGTATAIIVRSVATGGVGATNPNFTGTGLVQSYTPVTGEVGSSHEVTVSIVAAGTLSRATT